ncbi:MAG: class II fructose-bisphosphate aldolase [Actinobacteria bacterium]|nr:class II fructose-bisphosphate aldolase [Actinomycetota bacterium]MCL6088453.1 class II fructose-bisphosphate aldolase [Actinomycetota bacterium]
MALYNLKDVLTDAKKKRYAVIAAVAFNFDSAQAIVEAAEEKKSPVILLMGEGIFKYLNFEKLVQPIILLSEEVKAPVVVHLDHGKDFKIVMECIRAGFTSVMFDGSREKIDKNIEITKGIIEVAHTLDISVEGEVGVVGGLESFNEEIKEIKKEQFTKIEDAVRFARETKVDALAIAVGTIHGVFKSEPNIDFERISNIRNKIETPLVLHGGSGLSDEDFKKAIKSGITKINYFTNLLIDARNEVKNIINNNEDINYMEINYRAMRAIKNGIKVKMDVFGSSGKG